MTATKKLRRCAQEESSRCGQRQLYSLRERATNTRSTLSDQQTAESNADRSVKQSWDPAVGKSFSYAYRHLLCPRPRGFWNSAVCLSHGAAAWPIGTLAACSLATAGQCRDVRTADPSVHGRSRSLRDFNVCLGTDGLIGGETTCHRRTAIGSRHIVSPPPGRYVVLSVVNVYHHHHRSGGTPTTWAQLFPRSAAAKDDRALNADQGWDLWDRHW